MAKSRNTPCPDCNQYWDRYSSWPFDLHKRCPKCRDQAKRRATKERVARLRAKRKTTPPNRSRGGGSISESDLTLPRPKQRVKSKPISRVRGGREGSAKAPLAYQELPPLETLAEYNRKLYDRVLKELRTIAGEIENPRIVITGVKNNE